MGREADAASRSDGGFDTIDVTRTAARGAEVVQNSYPQCQRFGGRLTVVASIEEPALIERILTHLTQRACEEQKDSPFASRAPPHASLL